MAKKISLKQLKHHWPIYAYVFPSVLIVSVFSYYPCFNAIYHSFFRWNGFNVEEFIGLENFHRILGWSPTLWVVFAGWIVLLMMIVTGRPVSMKNVSPVVLLLGVVGLWFLFSVSAGKEDAGKFLNLSPQDVVGWYKHAAIPTIAGIVLGLSVRKRWATIVQGFCVVYGFLFFFYKSMEATGDQILWSGFAVTFILVVANVIKMVPSIVTAVAIHRVRSEKWQYSYRVLFVLPMIIPGMVYLLIWKYFFDSSGGALNRILNATGGMDLLIAMDKLMNWGGVFAPGKDPAWLGDVNLIIPSLILWGFPWVGVVGVLIYLAGLSSIGDELYEAAEIDGAGWFRKFLNIELPLIMTQVRINLVLMIIGTLQGYAFVLILLGEGGGPQGKALVPGLHMFNNAFTQGHLGYACALGLVLFVFILILTEINNRYVKVDK